MWWLETFIICCYDWRPTIIIVIPVESLFVLLLLLIIILMLLFIFGVICAQVWMKILFHVELEKFFLFLWWMGFGYDSWLIIYKLIDCFCHFPFSAIALSMKETEKHKSKASSSSSSASSNSTSLYPNFISNSSTNSATISKSREPRKVTWTKDTSYPH